MSFLLHDLAGGQLSTLNDLSPDDPLLKSGKLLEAVFTQSVDFLRNPDKIKQPSINGLMKLFWDLVGNRYTPTVLADGVPTLSFWCEMRQGKTLAVVMCPPNWCEMMKTDPYFQFGGLVYTASKAKDYWNLKIPGITESEQNFQDRACSFEAEVLHYLRRLDAEFIPNDYQKHILGKFPHGLASVPHLHYEGRPFPGEGPPFPVELSS